QLRLFGHRLIDDRFHAIHSTLDLSQVKTAVDFRRQQFVSDIERSHDRDALESYHFAAFANLEHFLVEIIDGLEQTRLLILGTRDAKITSHDRDLQAFRFTHASSSAGI